MNIREVDYSDLVRRAKEALEYSYSPYSKFRVGAALITESGKIYTGVNVENASYGATNCAERTAVFKAVSEGEIEIKAIAIAGDTEDFLYPCGICRQVLYEFGGNEMKVICSNSREEYKLYTLEELLPKAFK